MNQFNELDLGSNPPVPVSYDTIWITVDASHLNEYGRAFVREAKRVNPLWFDQNSLTDEEMCDYCKFLLNERIRSVQDVCSEWRKLKTLWIPAFVQYVLSTIGKVQDRKTGITFMPTLKEGEDIISLQEAREISQKIGSFDGHLVVVQDAMPRDSSGDPEVMSCAILADYVTSCSEVHPASTYVAAIVNAQLQDAEKFGVLYRVRYDNVQEIVDSVTHSSKIFH